MTTPGTARFDLSAGVAGTAFMDTLAMNLNIIVKTNVPWVLDMEGIVRAIGTSANMFWQGFWMSEAVIASVIANVGGIGVNTVPIATAPVIGANFDSTTDKIWDFNFTQTVATGSVTLHNFALSRKTSTGF